MIILYVLENCPYCNNSLKLLRQYKIKHQSIIVENTQEQKDFYKKQNKMSTFPQIFMKIDKNSFMKIGGNSDLMEIIEHCDNISDSSVSIDTVYYMYQNMFGK
jgi:glutaredoxin